MRILVASEDAAMASVLGRLLHAMADECVIARPDPSLEEAVLARKADVLVLDLQKDEGQGLKLLGAIRGAAPLCGVLVLSERASPSLRAQWLESGADDCLGKPFSLGELRARCGALLRRQHAVDAVLSLHHDLADPVRDAMLVFGGLELDRFRRQALYEGTAVRLTERESTVLEQLMLAPGAVVPRELLRDAFGHAASGVHDAAPLGANVVDVHVSAVRRKLQGCPGAPVIETVRGTGYRMVAGQTSALFAEVPAAVCGSSSAWTGLALRVGGTSRPYDEASAAVPRAALPGAPVGRPSGHGLAHRRIA
jgi:DNA-binding response OmpR family regulator